MIHEDRRGTCVAVQLHSPHCFCLLLISRISAEQGGDTYKHIMVSFLSEKQNTAGMTGAWKGQTTGHQVLTPLLPKTPGKQAVTLHYPRLPRNYLRPSGMVTLTLTSPRPSKKQTEGLVLPQTSMVSKYNNFSTLDHWGSW